MNLGISTAVLPRRDSSAERPEIPDEWRPPEDAAGRVAARLFFGREQLGRSPPLEFAGGLLEALLMHHCITPIVPHRSAPRCDTSPHHCLIATPPPSQIFLRRSSCAQKLLPTPSTDERAPEEAGIGTSVEQRLHDGYFRTSIVHLDDEDRHQVCSSIPLFLPR